MVRVSLDRVARCGSAFFEDGAVYDFKVSRAAVRGFWVHSLFNVLEGRVAVNPARGREIESAVKAAYGCDPV